MNARVTLVARNSDRPDRDWNYRTDERVVFLGSISSIKFALLTAFIESNLDIERIVIDRTGETTEYLELLSALPAGFGGDALFIRDCGAGFLSATGRGGDRVIYSLTPNDVRFYVEMHKLVTGRTVLEKTA
jgi:hypothetical protein